MKKEIFTQYLEAVAKLYDVRKEDVVSNSRKQDASAARHLLYYLCHIRPITITSIQKFMIDCGYDPKVPPIILGIKKVKKKIEEDADYRVIIDRIKNSIFI